ncbi:phage tail terminator family protein [Paenibacillus guangzhouensis]|uniref:phage tail terminator family protein n=1 Tax=Paenibacillus guangzhouensis TaxID=1473112 RepID=UPI0012676D5F|nr:hypothetical protein [Paenibacillus guangzhouensis]
MLRWSLDAIRTQLRAVAPQIPIYLKSAASGFEQPSFYLRLVEGTYEETHRTNYMMQAVWEIVYMPLEDEAGQADPFNLLDMADRLHQHFMALPSLPGAGKVSFDRTALRGQMRQGDFVLQITLEMELEGPQEAYDVMQDIVMNEQ